MTAKLAPVVLREDVYELHGAMRDAVHDAPARYGGALQPQCGGEAQRSTSS